MSDHGEYKAKAERFAHGTSNAGVVYALLHLAERIGDFTEYAKSADAADAAKGDLFMGYDPSVMSVPAVEDDHK